ncbi:Hypothetical protein FKW44_014321 [Caligus rogercresseyi]|uniref:Uncharacterized protein n=1 Tax=Caligus rogercresseyi TaxID=217165 RepID=A0A7T8GYQ2_CALRO|nr:Hypothetical protein FKW44_014321 [Caligus rogercresseyi]
MSEVSSKVMLQRGQMRKPQDWMFQFVNLWGQSSLQIRNYRRDLISRIGR